MQIGAVTFGSAAYIRWYLDTYNDSASVIGAIRSDTTFPAGIGHTAMGEGLRTACQMFSPLNGSRVGVPHIVIVATDGHASDDPIPAAKACWAAGIRVYVVGVTTDVDENQLRDISSPAHTKEVNYWTTPDYKSLTSILDSVKNSTCSNQKSDLPGACRVLTFCNVYQTP